MMANWQAVAASMMGDVISAAGMHACTAGSSAEQAHMLQPSTWRE
jgi:hypothetical protein